MREHAAEIRNKGANLAAIGLGDADYARIFREETGISFPLLIDERRKAYHAAKLGAGSLLHVLRPENFAARKWAKAAGHRQHKLGKNPFQLGGSFVFAPGNKDLFAHFSKTFGDNAPAEDVLAAIPVRV